MSGNKISDFHDWVGLKNQHSTKNQNEVTDGFWHCRLVDLHIFSFLLSNDSLKQLPLRRMMLSNHCVILDPDLFWIWGRQGCPCSSFQYSVDHVEFGHRYLAYNRCSSSILPLPCRDKLWAVELSPDDSGADRRSITWSPLPTDVTSSLLSILVTALEVNCQKEDNKMMANDHVYRFAQLSQDEWLMWTGWNTK